MVIWVCDTVSFFICFYFVLISLSLPLSLFLFACFASSISLLECVICTLRLLCYFTIGKLYGNRQFEDKDASALTIFTNNRVRNSETMKREGEGNRSTDVKSSNLGRSLEGITSQRFPAPMYAPVRDSQRIERRRLYLP